MLPIIPSCTKWERVVTRVCSCIEDAYSSARYIHKLLELNWDEEHRTKGHSTQSNVRRRYLVTLKQFVACY